MDEERVFYITKDGLKKIKKEYETLIELRRFKNKRDVPEIWESEELNPEYISFLEDLNLLDARITELENILKNCVLIKSPRAKKEKKIVKIGAKVKVEIDGRVEDEFIIVGSAEANPSLGKISNESPVGKALLGRRVGEKVVVSSPIRTTYKIKRIKYS